MGLDILGKQGEAIGRTAANLSPEARETLKTALAGRKAGQNERVIGEMEAISGVKPGSVKTVEDIQKPSRGPPEAGHRRGLQGGQGRRATTCRESRSATCLKRRWARRPTRMPPSR